MRLGGFYSAERAEQFEALCPALDPHRLSAIRAPEDLARGHAAAERSGPRFLPRSPRGGAER